MLHSFHISSHSCVLLGNHYQTYNVIGKKEKQDWKQEIELAFGGNAEYEIILLNPFSLFPLLQG